VVVGEAMLGKLAFCDETILMVAIEEVVVAPATNDAWVEGACSGDAPKGDQTASLRLEARRGGARRVDRHPC
jgi:hypothetical protein